ncbi:MAG: hypothetical protein E7040_08680 [Lentisphaerae bacterium]|nr:hypothetical protein [Lentisphaerota bacterium]
MNLKPFEEVRGSLEKQFEKAVYSSEDCWSIQKLQDEWNDHKRKHPEEERLAAQTFLISMVLRHAPIAVEKENPFPGKLNCGDLFQDSYMTGIKIAEEKIPGVSFDPTELNKKYGIIWMVDRSHVAPDWEAILHLGLPGLIDRAKVGNAPFHKAIVTVYESLAEFCRRVGKINENPVYLKIADHAPETLYEAFALAVVFHNAIEYAFQLVRSMGKFDALYLDFYRKDLNEGRLTRESAKELIKYFWIEFYAQHQGQHYGKNFCFGPEINELSYLGMETFYELNVVDPKLSVLIREDTPQDFMELYAKCIRDGRTSIVTLNYDLVVEGLIRHGRTPEDARNVIPIGCYEPAVAGKEVSCSGGNLLYLPTPLLNAVMDQTEYPDFESFVTGVKNHIRQAVKVMQEMQTYSDLAWKYVHPVPLFSGTYESCLERGRDVSEAGAKYNMSGCVICHFADLVDSMTAVKYLVYDKELCTFPELRKILKNDWAGYERLRRIALREPGKWGNNHAETDELAKGLATFLSDLFWTLPNARGGFFFPALFGQRVVEVGATIGALPSGRKAGEPVSKNMCAVIGMDKNGITGLMNSILKIDMRQFPNGTCTDIMLHPSSVTGDTGIKLMVSLIRTFIRQGGTGIHFNIFDAEVLRDAQKNPEKYNNLQVRVCGWNVRFNDLSPAAQETFIREAESAFN